jgi:PAS domain S-box-containing protein
MEMDVVVEANSAACEMHGYQRPEFIGLNPTEFMLPESHVLFMENVTKAEPGSFFESLAIHIHKDGSPFHVEVRSNSIIPLMPSPGRLKTTCTPQS